MTARDVFELDVVARSSRRRRWRWLGSLIAGVLAEEPVPPAEDTRDVRVLRRSDGAVLLEQAGVRPDVVDLLVRDWETLGPEEFEARWRPAGGGP